MLAEVRTTRRLRGGRAVNARAKNLARPVAVTIPDGQSADLGNRYREPQWGKSQATTCDPRAAADELSCADKTLTLIAAKESRLSLIPQNNNVIRDGVQQ